MDGNESTNNEVLEDTNETDDNSTGASIDEQIATANDEEPRYALRPRREPVYKRFESSMDDPEGPTSYGTQFLQNEAQQNDSQLSDAMEELNNTGSREGLWQYVTGYMFNQMSAKAGIRKHGQVAIDALYAEFLQLHEKGVFKGQHTKDLTPRQKRQALRAKRDQGEEMWEGERTHCGGRPHATVDVHKRGNIISHSINRLIDVVHHDRH